MEHLVDRCRTTSEAEAASEGAEANGEGGDVARVAEARHVGGVELGGARGERGREVEEEARICVQPAFGMAQ